MTPITTRRAQRAALTEAMKGMNWSDICQSVAEHAYNEATAAHASFIETGADDDHREYNLWIHRHAAILESDENPELVTSASMVEDVRFDIETKAAGETGE